MNMTEFCARCKHKEVKANQHPCDFCMEMGINKVVGEPLGFDRKEIEI